MALLFLDLDDFKRVNDTYGHLAGSRTLRELGTLLTFKLPPGAIPARYGGDEFVIILPGADIDAARHVGEDRCATTIEKHRAADRSAKDLRVDELRPCTSLAPIGVAELSHGEHVGPFGSLERRQNALLRLADTAMYAAKAAGENRVVVSSVWKIDRTPTVKVG